ncbi:MAG TPA: DUF2877 domain-containing protein [Burkholderiaceae bacterium]|nr:DUF2877 domain-containing protein [Burkholderiaceae bacterium]
MSIAVDSIGYFVPRHDFSGRVHSVFAQACNIAWHDTLLTLCASGVGEGPTQLRLARDAPHDLRALFDVGEPVDCRHAGLQTRRTELRLLHATVWRPAPMRDLLSPSRIDAHLCIARRRLAQRRLTHTGVIDGEGAGVVSGLRDACRALDSEQALRHADRLIGWGEGLTPAGDDFLIGLIAGLDALVRADERRRGLRSAIASALRGATPRTTPIAAHYLQLAAGGHHTEALVRLRNALLCEDSADVVDAALRNALAVGATSGADTVSGLLAALQAWLPVPSIVEAA